MIKKGYFMQIHIIIYSTPSVIIPTSSNLLFLILKKNKFLIRATFFATEFFK